MARTVEQVISQLVQETLGAQAATILRLQAELEVAREMLQEAVKNTEEAFRQMAELEAQRDSAIKSTTDAIELAKQGQTDG